MRIRAFGVGVLTATWLLLPSLARAESSGLSVQGSTTTVEVAAPVPVRQSGSFTVTPGTGAWNVSGSTVAVLQQGQVAARNGKKFQVDTGAIGMGSSAETPMALFVNLSTNTINAFIDEFRFSPRVTANTTPNSIVYRFYANSIVTSSGTAQQVLPCRTDVPLNSNQVLFFNLPTAPTPGTLMDTIVVQGSTARFQYDGRFIITPGKKMLVTAETGLIASLVAFSVQWWEE